MSLRDSPQAARNARLGRTLLVAYGFMLPLLVVKVVYTFWPIVFGIYLAFTDYNIISPPKWVGLRNFAELFGLGAFAGRGPDPDFWYGLTNSLKYLLVVPIIQIFSVALAMLVNRQIPAIGFFRTAYYVPVVTSFAVVGLMWGWMYNAFGPINFILTRLHLMNPANPSSLLTNPTTALLALMFVTLWKGIGYYMVLYLAGLQSIDRNLEEAALIDGANRAQVFWNITLPGLRPVILVCSLLSTISAIKVFDEIFVMTGGGPAGSTYTAMFFVYSAAFQNFRYGYAAAAGLVVAVVSLLFGMVNFRLTRGGNAQ